MRSNREKSRGAGETHTHTHTHTFDTVPRFVAVNPKLTRNSNCYTDIGRLGYTPRYASHHPAERTVRKRGRGGGKGIWAIATLAAV